MAANIEYHNGEYICWGIGRSGCTCRWGEGKVGFGGLLFACLSRPEVSFTSDAVLRRFSGLKLRHHDPPVARLLEV